jgi:hypothetical protein
MRPNTLAQDHLLHHKIALATHGRSIQVGQNRLFTAPLDWARYDFNSRLQTRECGHSRSDAGFVPLNGRRSVKVYTSGRMVLPGFRGHLE